MNIGQIEELYSGLTMAQKQDLYTRMIANPNSQVHGVDVNDSSFERWFAIILKYRPDNNIPFNIIVDSFRISIENQNDDESQNDDETKIQKFINVFGSELQNVLKEQNNGVNIVKKSTLRNKVTNKVSKVRNWFTRRRGGTKRKHLKKTKKTHKKKRKTRGRH
jgi:hypothetical protein